MNTSFFGELLQTICRTRSCAARPGRDRRGDASARSENLVELCEDLLSGRGEASGVALAREILGRYAELTTGPRIAFFEALAQRFGTGSGAHGTSDRGLARGARRMRPPPKCMPRRNRAGRSCSAGLTWRPAAPRALVRMREQLMDVLEHRDDLRAVDDDFVHLFSSWFNRGFLVLRRIDWSTPAIVLEKIIRYEAVHEIHDWEDLRRRIDPPDRRCYAFFHPALVDEPLIFVEVALTRDIPAAIAPILATGREVVEPDKARTAAFYSISNCQRGLAGVSFGNFLIKQVVEEVQPRDAQALDLRDAVAGDRFRRLAQRANAPSEKSAALTEADKAVLAALDQPGWWRDEETAAQAAGSGHARGGVVFPARAQRARTAGRCGSALPSRQRRAARAHQLARRHFGTGDGAGARADGELSLRARRHREEPRGLCGRPHRGRLWRRAAPAAPATRTGPDRGLR